MRFFIGFIAVTWMMLGLAIAETVSGVSYTLQGGSTHVVIKVDNPDTPPKVSELGGEKPRVILDWPQADLGRQLAQGQPIGDLHVQGLRYAPRGQKGARLVFDLEKGAKLVSHSLSAGQVQLLIQGSPKSSMEQALLLTADRYFERGTPYPRVKPSIDRGQVMAMSNVSQVQKTPRVKRKPIIIIDPGHGGRDPGSIGKRHGTYEKNITLKAAKELRAQLQATGRYEVILTRSGDSYVDHAERIRIGRAGGGDLFISIHADSTKTSKARGASVYTLSDRAKKRTQEVINTQNWVMDVDLTVQSDPVGDILVDLAQRKTISQSTKFADGLIRELSGSTRLIGNTHRRAGYFVLLAPDVPAVLLELGFLSNSHDEKLLRSPAHRKKMMRSVVRAINGYFDDQKP